MTSAIILVAFALNIFTVAQIVLHLRARQNLQREKLEDLFNALNHVSNAFTSLFYAIQSKDEALISRAFRNLDESFYRPRSLILLYFPYITEVWEDLVLAQAHQLVAKFNECASPGKIDLYSCKENVDKAALYVRYLQNFLARIQELSSETFSFHFDRLFRRRIRIKMPQKIYDGLVHDGVIKNGMIGIAHIEAEIAAVPQPPIVPVAHL